MSKISWGAKVSQDFNNRTEKMRANFGWTQDHRSWLMGCIAFESGETFSPAIKNAAGSGATGLIQFMPATARDLGTTTDVLAKMTAVQQLDYVEKYFRPYYKRINSLSDMYMAILLPKYVGQPDDAVLFSGGTAYRQNAGLDANKDGKITKAEASAKVRAKWEKGLTFAILTAN
jgi:hypothetical protein